ncbi:hypothetical protein NE466_03075 [Veillonella parvula]|jgi:hypothetical protein|uniref:Uncharacterized protein n=1 Tax=Veillonella parvula TaxID=29466 RepID=A0AB38YM59_VEIPA|nr:hypothetical protein [Veillonella parvula]DAF80199.1 MAG TPA: major capsid protein [Caudoviricetes sp.]EFB86778.1 hypothetical protein HMPREF1035_1389 [Veillonella parvula ATCC 17745]MCB6804433.1 hypothetical protein [Veillonella parvula]MCQ4926507.1 hypothetical protein [Veillonella parvula]MCQ4957697.1 hypothetical protein [Veillonella parvula]
MMIDKENVFFWKKAITANTNSEVVMNGEGGDAVVAPWLVIRIDADVTGTGLFNVYTSDKENMADAKLLTGVTLPANAKAGEERVMRIPAGAKKFIRINANNMTAGTITAFLTFDTNIAR